MKELLLPYCLVMWLLFKFGVIKTRPRNVFTAVSFGVLIAFSLLVANRFWSPVDFTKSTQVRAPHAVMSPAVGFQVKHVFVEHNQYVKKGELLYTLYDTYVQSDIRAVESELALADIELKRLEKIGQYASQAELDDARNKVTDLEEQLHSLEVSLDDYTVEAPFDGKVSLVMIADGTVIGSLHIYDTSKKFVQMRIPEQAYPFVKAGQFAEFYVDSHAGHVFRARVKSIGTAKGETTGTLLPQEESLTQFVGKGMSAKGRIVVLEMDSETAAMLPIGATGSAWISAEKPSPLLGFVDIIGGATVRLHSAKAFLSAM
ncbi:efflux RND transporter periplasmic adaptor subunit [Thalassotalea agarivorans]|uniref:Multidrug resistance efflux pump n=1 Tax=Thalassotalea agarivorans TaxID=349064 RepID=A0A1I0BR83_THASX|nr:HlyD family efflux transporter periplasmic adaptor subunit [Thalassotalea agarivorans]SET09414.1 Multidrug resistance efflux pump [Thalassotalea agarivorans]